MKIKENKNIRFYSDLENIDENFKKKLMQSLLLLNLKILQSIEKKFFLIQKNIHLLFHHAHICLGGGFINYFLKKNYLPIYLRTKVFLNNIKKTLLE